MSVETFERESTVPMWAHCTKDGTATSPDQGVTITITDPDGTAIATDAAMTEDDTGEFVYYYTTTSSSVVGEWHYTCLYQDGTGGTAKYLAKSGAFYLR